MQGASMKLKRVNLKQFKDLVADGVSPSNLIIPKTYVVDEIKTVGDESDRTELFVISTGAVDRDGDTINPKGWMLDNFAKGGSILFGHKQSELPVATPVKTFVQGGKLMGSAKFASAEDGNPFADSVYRMVKAGFLRSASVGFLPHDFEISERTDMSVGFDFLKQELLEWSVVPVPANPEAVRVAGQKGMDILPIIEWHEKALDGACYDYGFCKDDLSKCYGELKGSVSVAVDADIDGSHKSEEALPVEAASEPAPPVVEPEVVEPAKEPETQPGQQAAEDEDSIDIEGIDTIEELQELIASNIASSLNPPVAGDN
jgi:HK97 family phage prohead protease